MARRPSTATPRDIGSLIMTVRGRRVMLDADLARHLRHARIPVIGGFHSPMERECLDLLLRGQQPVVVCAARGIEGMRVPAAWRAAVSERRLPILSPFEPRRRRVTTELAERRNRFVAHLSRSVLVPHAAARRSRDVVTHVPQPDDKVTRVTRSPPSRAAERPRACCYRSVRTPGLMPAVRSSGGLCGAHINNFAR